MFSLPLALLNSMILLISLSSPLCQKAPALRPALAIASLLILLRRSVGVKQFPTGSAPFSFPLSYCGGHPRTLDEQRSQGERRIHHQTGETKVRRGMTRRVKAALLEDSETQTAETQKRKIVD
jgi:hypothetical protein